MDDENAVGESTSWNSAWKWAGFAMLAVAGWKAYPHIVDMLRVEPTCERYADEAADLVNIPLYAFTWGTSFRASSVTPSEVEELERRGESLLCKAKFSFYFRTDNSMEAIRIRYVVEPYADGSWGMAVTIPLRDEVTGQKPFPRWD